MSQRAIKIDFQPTPKQWEAWQILQDKTTNDLLFGGGAGGGKSYLGCFWLLTKAIEFPKSRWLMGRSVLANLKKSTLLTFFDIAGKAQLRPAMDFRYNQQDNVIKLWNGSEIYLVDLAHLPSDPHYDRIGSTEFTGAFIDEVNQVTSQCKDVVTARLRYKITEFDLIPKLLMSCNPTKNWVYTDIYKPAKDGTLPDNTAFVQALAKDNTHNPKSYLKRLESLNDKVMRERLWFGNWEYEDDEASLFKINDLNDMFTNKVDDGEVFVTCDVARMGRDRTVIMVWKGLKVIHIEAHEKTSIPKVVELLEKTQEKYQVKRSHELVDEDGVGGGVVDLRKCRGFVGGSSPHQEKQREYDSKFKVNYLNLRAQCYYELSRLVREGKIAIETESTEHRDLIISELEQVKGKDYDKDGKLKVIAKDTIKEHLGRSPDFADALMMRMLFELDKPKELDIRFV